MIKYNAIKIFKNHPMLSWTVHWFWRLESFAPSTDYNSKQVLVLSSIKTCTSVFTEMSRSSFDSSSADSPLSHQCSRLLWTFLGLRYPYLDCSSYLVTMLSLPKQEGACSARFSKQAGWISFLEQCSCGKNDTGSSIQNSNFWNSSLFWLITWTTKISVIMKQCSHTYQCGVQGYSDTKETHIS